MAVGESYSSMYRFPFRHLAIALAGFPVSFYGDGLRFWGFYIESDAIVWVDHERFYLIGLESYVLLGESHG